MTKFLSVTYTSCRCLGVMVSRATKPAHRTRPFCGSFVFYLPEIEAALQAIGEAPGWLWCLRQRRRA